MELAGVLRRYRLGQRLTQKEVAARLGITREYYAMLEEGHAEPSPRLLHILEHELGVTTSYLLNGRAGKASR